jgi:hypothetical protein
MSTPDDLPEAANVPQGIPGERGPASVDRARSLQSHVSNLLAAGLMTALGVGALGWYYAHVFREQAQAAVRALQAVRAKAAGSAPLPLLGAFQRPGVVPAGGGDAHPLDLRLFGPPSAPRVLGDSANRGDAAAD